MPYSMMCQTAILVAQFTSIHDALHETLLDRDRVPTPLGVRLQGLAKLGVQLLHGQMERF